MTHEERASIIKKFLLLLFIIGLVAAVFFYPKSKTKAAALPPLADDALELVHFHQPGSPESDQLAEILEKVQRKYDRQVRVVTIDVKETPELAAKEKLTKFPHVIINTSTGKAFEFTGLWPQPQLERKVDEILRGLKRFGKNWRPPVKGMEPVAH